MTAHRQGAFGFPPLESPTETSILAVKRARIQTPDALRKMNSLAISLFDESFIVPGVLPCPVNDSTPSLLCRYQTIAQQLPEPFNGWGIAIF
jgi:hypothetical protein